MFLIAKEEEIKKGLTTDIYFKRTEEILLKKNINKIVWAEFTTQSIPYEFVVFAGLEECTKLLEGKEIDLWAIKEGTIFKGVDINGIPVPVMAIEGNYVNFAIYETPLLGFICQASGITTKAARFRIASRDAILLSFGIRRMHPAISPFIDYFAYMGGCDGVSSIKGAEVINKKPRGTMPHSLIILLGEENAWLSFDEIIDKDVPRIALIDTYGDEKVTAVKAAEILKNLSGVRLDTPSSRRGDFAKIVREVRWELDIRGYKDVKIFVSGGLDEEIIPLLYEAGARGFGVGTSLSNAKTIDYAMDIVEVEGKPCAKKGKFGGKKKVFRCKNCLELLVLKYDEEIKECPLCKGEMENFYFKIIERGKIIYKFPDIDEKRKYVIEQIQRLKISKLNK
ncbi:MAG: nicotinate phosphoribosyltransferase [candidate division WOR-3 bacterium]